MTTPLCSDYDRTSRPLGAYPLRNGPVDDIACLDGIDASTVDGKARLVDANGVIQQRSAAQHYHWLADRAGAMAKELKHVTERPSEYYAAQKALLEAADYLRDAAERMEGGHE